MKRIGVTGSGGFIGSALMNILALSGDEFEPVGCKREWFDNADDLQRFVEQCDVVVHLAGVNRSENAQELYDVNVSLAERLTAAMESSGRRAHLIFASSVLETGDSAYGRAKRRCVQIMSDWVRHSGASMSKFVIPNVFGPFCRPFYNSFVATFCYQLNRGLTPEIIDDRRVELIYVDTLCRRMINVIRRGVGAGSVETVNIEAEFTASVSQVLELLQSFAKSYDRRGEIPPLKDTNHLNLFNTYRSYASLAIGHPFDLVPVVDQRGAFVEVLREGCGGQVSFSTTREGVTRGNHFHTRKIERFVVLRGRAVVRMRRVGSHDTVECVLDGDHPMAIDMPVWYTHNITNVGQGDLYTLFWINEAYNADDADTFYEQV